MAIAAAPEAQPVVTEIEPVHWQHKRIGVLPVDTTTRLFSNYTGDDIDTALLIIPGYGEGEWAIRRALTTCNGLGVRAIGAIIDTEQIAATKEDLTSFSHEIVPAITVDLELRDSEASTPRKAIGHSMGGGMLGLAIGEAPELFGDVGFLEPIGHDTAYRKEILPDEHKRRRQFVRQFARVVTGYYTGVPITDKLSAAIDIVGQIGGDLWPAREHRFKTKLSIPINVDCGRAVLNHAMHHKIAYVLGRRDPLVQRFDIERSLELHTEHQPHLQPAYENLAIEESDLKHAYLGWNHGAEHIERVTRLLSLT